MEKILWNLAIEYKNRGIEVDLLGFKTKGAKHIPQIQGLNLFHIKPSNRFKTRICALNGAPKGWKKNLILPVLMPLKTDPSIRRLPGVKAYLYARAPELLIVGKSQENLCLMLAKKATQTATRIVLSEHYPISQGLSAHRRKKSWRWRYLLPLLRKAYLQADGVVAVSQAVADELEKTLDLPTGRVQVIYNPVVNDELWERINQPVDHPWFENRTIPLLLNAAKMGSEKDQETLLRAFAIARAERPMRLIILGNGRHYSRLQSLAKSLGIADDVDMPGFEANPLRFMARADGFVLTSKFEGLPTVLIEALAAGCPVISTDCGGPREILDNGRYGKLVPVGDPNAVSLAILETLDNPPPKDKLQARARKFSVHRAADEYIKLGKFSQKNF